MLNEYKDKQLLVYNLFMSDINNNCVTHAYLIDENNCDYSYEMVLAFIKRILCGKEHVLDESSACNLCKRIDSGNYPELKIIEPDGIYIKKNQILDLQKEFSKSAVEGNKKIYIIRDCEKMRAEAANSMLKFLEEPEDDIIAFLMTNNINNVMSTIISRCKIVKFNSDNSVKKIDEKLENLAIDFVCELENKGLSAILSIKELWFSVISSKERDNMILVFDKMIDIYYDVMNVLMKRDNLRCLLWKDKILDISLNNSLEMVLEKINILLEYKDSIKFNVNSNLLMDSLIISIGGIKNGSWC